jgi:hypothetical protein
MGKAAQEKRQRRVEAQARRAAMEAERLPAWTPFQPATNLPATEAQIRQMVEITGDDREVIEQELARITSQEKWRNSRYTVFVDRIESKDGSLPTLVHLSIKRNDRGDVGVEHFRDFQRIKNELVGPECEGVELYPAESRLVDQCSQYHEWVWDSPTFRYPFGFSERAIRGPVEGPGRQRPFEEG